MMYSTTSKEVSDGGETTLAAILEEGLFNCVSSAVLYNAVAADLDLEVDAVEEPGSFLSGHVYSRLRSGDRWLIVETTNARGFAAERRLGNSDRVLTPTGLVANIWTNRAASACERKRYHEGAVLVLLALSIEPGCAATNGRVALVKWARELANQQKFAEAQRVHAVGLEIEPKNHDLLNNRKVVFAQWAAHLAKADKIDDALDILRRACKEDPSSAGDYEKEQAALFTSPGEALIKKGDWQQAHDSAAPGRKKLTGRTLKNLTDWQKGVYLRWGNKHLDAGDYEKAMEVYQKGSSVYPSHSALDNNLWYTAGKWLSQTLAKQGADRARELAVALKKDHDGKKLDVVLNQHVSLVLAPYLKRSDYTEARAALKKHAELLNKSDALKQTHRIIDAHAASLWQKKEWQATHEVYATALKEMPADSHLTSQAAAVWDRQARPHMERKEWKEAVEVYEQGLKAYPKSFLLENNLAYCKQQMSRTR